MGQVRLPGRRSPARDGWRFGPRRGMTVSRAMSARAECEELGAAAYVLDALEPDEAEAFRRHLESCAHCRQEVERYAPAALALARAVPQLEAPRELRRRVLREVRDSPVPAATRTDSDRSGGRVLAGPSRNAWSGAQRLGSGGRSRRSRRGHLTLPRPAFAGLGTLALAAGVAAVVLSAGRSAPQVIRARTFYHGASASLVRLQDGHGELRIRDMPAPRPGHVYEVWVEHGNAAPEPTDALFDVDRRGAAIVAVPGVIRPPETVMVTAEPDGGTSVPTSRPVLVASLS
jgi:anti-sigma-K factor RskA